MPTLKGIETYLVLIALALGTWYAAELLTPEEPPAPEPDRGQVDYYSKGITRTQMDETGKPKQLLVADVMTHYQGNDRTELIQPVLTLYSKTGGPPWVIHAESATLPADSDLIFMNGDVLIVRDADAEGRTVRITTRNVRVQPGKDYAETDEFIRVVSPPDELTGVGAKVNYGEDFTATILANVRRFHAVQ